MVAQNPIPNFQTATDSTPPSIPQALTPQFREIDYGNNVAQRTLCVLVLDLSGSMAIRSGSGDKRRIDMLNEGIEAFYHDLMKDETARNRVRLAIVIVGGVNDTAELMMDWTDAIDFFPIKFRENGMTPLGQGMLLALNLIEQERINLRDNGINYTRPWVIAMTDGLPTDSQDVWQAAINQCHQAEQNNQCIIYPIAIDAGVQEVKMLKQLSILTPPVHLNSVKFVEFFVWLSASLKTVSQSAPGETVQLGSISPWATIQS